MSSTRYHLTKDSCWTQCHALKRPGQMVTQCPIGDRAHVIGRQGIADAGGGWERRVESGVRISIFISGRRTDGTFSSDAPSRHTEYDSNGKVLTLRERMHPKKTSPVD
jgi:hypothetical protein